MQYFINKRLSIEFKHIVKITTKQIKRKRYNLKKLIGKQENIEIMDQTKSLTLGRKSD